MLQEAVLYIVGIFNSNPGLHPLDTNNTLSTPLVMTKLHISRHCQISLERQNHLQLRIINLEVGYDPSELI